MRRGRAPRPMLANPWRGVSARAWVQSMGVAVIISGLLNMVVNALGRRVDVWQVHALAFVIVACALARLRVVDPRAWAWICHPTRQIQRSNRLQDSKAKRLWERRQAEKKAREEQADREWEAEKQRLERLDKITRVYTLEEIDDMRRHSNDGGTRQ